ncbi:MAG: adenosine kinase [Simkaniaceae bacterium]|nr:adenosine kinase [Simkaniaceae bacterium]
MIKALLLILSIHLCATNDYKVLGLSSAFIDHLVLVDDETLNSITHKKGSWMQVELSTIENILSKSAFTPQTVPGGSGINVIKGLAKLGESCAVIGRVGSDSAGVFFVEKLQELGITSHLSSNNLPTGQVLSLITPDGQRTLRTYLGASYSKEALPLDLENFKGATLFHVEGYQLLEEKVLLKSMQLAKEANCKISLDLANAELVKVHKSTIFTLLAKYVDIVFCNESEAFELTHLPPDKACSVLATFCEVAVVTAGEKGSYAQKESIQVFTPAKSVKAIDTTAAGDFFASGFLFGYLKGKSIAECNQIGSITASNVVQVIGAEMPEPRWNSIQKEISLHL